MSGMSTGCFTAPEEHIKPSGTGCDGSDDRSSPFHTSITSSLSHKNSVKASKNISGDDFTWAPKPEVLESPKTETTVTINETASPPETPIITRASTSSETPSATSIHATPGAQTRPEDVTDVRISTKVEAVAEADAEIPEATALANRNGFAESPIANGAESNDPDSSLTCMGSPVQTADDKVEDTTPHTCTDTQPVADDLASSIIYQEPGDRNQAAPYIKSDGDSVDASASQLSPISEIPVGKVYKTVRFHRDGDMFVKVREDDGKIVFYEVVSSCLAAASPVWRKVIYGGAQSRPETGHWTLNMLEDDHFALFVIFKIVHYHYYDMPKRPDVSRFYKIALVAEKYDCTHLFVPYMKEWIGDLNWHVIMANEHNDDDKTLWITWVFGDAKWFSKMISKVAYKATIDEYGQLRNATGQPWRSLTLPDELLELIASTRARALRDIIQSVSTPLVKLMMKQRNGQVFCRAKEQIDECESMILGSTISSLVQLNLWPFPSPDTYKGSVQALANGLMVMKVSHFAVPGVKPHLDDHRPCGLGHKEVIAAILDTPVKLSGYLAWRLTQQAIKTGAYNEEFFKQYQDLEELEPVDEGVKQELHVKTELREDATLMDAKLEEDTE